MKNLIEPTTPIKILFVDDHYLNQVAIQYMITRWSDYISVDIAENGKVGVEKFQSGNYDIILMDTAMPVMDGFEATSRIRTIDCHIPIIAFTNYGANEPMTSVGANCYITKPYKSEELKSKILELLSQKPQEHE